MRSWLRSLSPIQRVLTLVGLGVLLAHFSLVAIARKPPSGDFQCNREFGRRFLAGEPLYAGSICFNYMPIAAAFWSPLALVGLHTGLAIRYGVALVCVALVVRWLRTMMPLVGRTPFTATALLLVLGLRYLIRDLDDGGPHLALLAMLVGGAYCVWLGRPKTGATWWGLSIALKMTPGLLLPFLLWSRQWKLALYTAVATALWIVLPALWMGPGAWWHEQQAWNRVALAACSGSATVDMEINDVRVTNQSLKYALIHALHRYDETDPMYVAHADWSLLNLDRDSARRLAVVGIGLCFLGYQLLGRRELPAVQRTASSWPTDAASWLPRFSGLLLLMLLFSPVTWVQHMVWALPALYCVLAADWSGVPAKIVTVVLMFHATVCLLANQELVGNRLYGILLANHVHTLCLLNLLGLIVVLRLSTRAAANHRRLVVDSTSFEKAA